MILYRKRDDGSFLCGDTATGIADYAYPSSPYAAQAKRNPAAVAQDMLRHTAEMARRGIAASLPPNAIYHPKNAEWLAELREHGTAV
jgi:hypothetical protein